VVVTMRVVAIMIVIVTVTVLVIMVGMFAMFVIMLMAAIVAVMFGLRLWRLRRIGCRALDDLAADAVAIATAARIAMARPAAIGTVFRFLFGFTMRALVGLDQGLTVGDRDLIIVRMDFAEGEEAVAIAAVFNEGGLKRWLYARDLGEIDIAAKLFALGRFEIKLFNAIATHHDDPGLFRVGGIDQHFVGHVGALDGGRHAWRPARNARPGDTTVHLIRG
jgi:hypothetical protein